MTALWLREIWRKAFPPRISSCQLDEIRDATFATTVLAHQVANKFEKVANEARERNVDPLAVLVREVRASRRSKN